MKKFLSIIVASLVLSTNVKADVNISVSVNIDLQPAWGPTGYDVANFYYIPEIDIYYDVTNALFYYLSGSAWVSAKYLPTKYRSYDLYSMYKVVINDDPKPWLNNKNHRRDFKDFRNDRTQVPIRHSTDSRYAKSKQNTNSWVEPRPTTTSTPRASSSSSQKQTSSNPTRTTSSSTSGRQSSSGQNTTRTSGSSASKSSSSSSTPSRSSGSSSSSRSSSSGGSRTR